MAMGPNIKMEKAKNFKSTLGRLLKYLKPQAPLLILVILLMVVQVFLYLLGPYVLGLATTEIANAGLQERAINFDLLLKYCIFVICSYTLSNTISFLSGFFISKIIQMVVYNLRKQAQDKLDDMPLNYYDTHTNGEILSRVVNDTDLISMSLQQSMSQIINGVLTLIGILGFMFAINWMIALASLVALPLTGIIAMIVAKKSQRQFINQQLQTGKLNSHVEETYSGHKVVKLYSLEQEKQQGFDTINAELKTAASKAQIFSGLIMPLTKFINNLTYVGICILGAYLAINQVIGVGFILSAIQYSRQFMEPIVQISQIANIIQSTAAASERVFEIIDEEVEIKDIDEISTLDAVKLLDRDNLLQKIQLTDEQQKQLLSKEGAESLFEVSAQAIADVLTPQQVAILKTPESPSGIVGNVTFDRVDFSYDKNKELIKDMNLKIKPGDSIAIVGPTGAGKTTLVNLLMRFYEIDKGSIDIDGIDVRNFKRHDLRSLYAMVLQDTWLFSGTIRDNIAYGKPDATMEEVIAAAKKAHIHHFIKTLPLGYDTILEEDASSISQGQKQLLTIARAILKDSKILILDEATSSVDTRTEQYIQSAMTAMMKDKTSFVIAHRLSTIKNANMIIVMNKGTVIECGTHKELLEKKGFYADLYNSQFNNALIS